MEESVTQAAGLRPSIRIADIEIVWEPTTGTCTFARLPVAMMWIDTTLAGLMAGVQTMVGTERFAMALQSEGRKSVEADWQVMSASPDFETGFATIARIAAVAGWGEWNIVSRDDSNRTCTFRVRNAWEPRYQRALGVCWGSGMLAGKFAGYCTKFYGTNCWADQTRFAARGDEYDEFVVHPSPRTVDEEIGWLMQTDRATRGDLQAALDRLTGEIEQRRLAEERARMLSAPVENILDSAGVWLHVLDAQGRIIIWNRAAHEISGFSRDEVMGRNRVWEQICPAGRNLQNPDERLRSIMEGRPVENLETMIRAADGRERVLLWTVRPLIASEGMGGGSLGMALDITEKKQAEGALRHSEERLRLALESTADGLWDWDIMTGRAYFSPHYFAMLGLPPDQQPPNVETWRSLVHPDDVETVEQRLRDYMEQRTTAYVSEFRMRKTDGTWCWVLSRGKIVEWTTDGRPARMAGTHTDISQRRLDEEKRLAFERHLLHTQKLESMGLMAGGIAHDFNNLLMAILGNLDIALSRVPAPAPAHENIRQAIKAAERSADLTRQMLAYSGRGHLLVRPLALSRIVQDTATLLRATIPKSANLVLKADPSLPAVTADEGQMGQIVMNLVTNAAEALSGKPGVIEVSVFATVADDGLLRTGRVAPPPQAGHFVCLEVRDTGSGMDEPTCEKFLDPFFSTKAVGRGLGMAAVLGIVRGHRGTLTVDSAPGRGTCIRVLLPAAETGTAPRQAPPPLPVVRLKGHALVVDDEEQVRDTCRNMLEVLGMTCSVADGGAEAIRLLQKEPSRFAGALLDLSMPGMDGFSTLRELHRIRPDLKVVLISGYDQGEAMKRFGKDGPAGFLQKPFTTRRMGEVLQHIFV